jgi:hypothetical protein
LNKRDHRAKASEVFRESRFVFAEKTTFAKAFPMIKSLRIEITQSQDSIWQKEMGPSVYHENNIGEFVDCQNSLCYNGGVSLGELLREMARKNKKEGEFSKICQGYEGSPKGRRRYRRCVNFFKLKINIEYNPPAPIDPKRPG